MVPGKPFISPQTPRATTPRLLHSIAKVASLAEGDGARHNRPWADGSYYTNAARLLVGTVSADISFQRAQSNQHLVRGRALFNKLRKQLRLTRIYGSNQLGSIDSTNNFLLTRDWQRRRQTFRTNTLEHWGLVKYLARWQLLGALVGVLGGLSSGVFLLSLEWATKKRISNPWMLFLLPMGGFAIGLIYHVHGDRSALGNNMVIDEIHSPQAWLPRRMAPLIYLSTIATHLFGGSAGREGTAIQMSAGLTDWFARIWRFNPNERRNLLVAAIAGGFGAVFGVPLAGAVFALEVQAIGRLRYDALIPAITASLVGDQVVRGLGVDHLVVPEISAITFTPLVFAKVVVAGIIFGLSARLFIDLTRLIRRVLAAKITYPPLRPVVGALVVIALTYASGTRDYLGLSLPLITNSLTGVVGVATFAFALKLLFTSITLGSGFQGGEVTPLFVIGSTLGATLGHVLGLPIHFMAALGFVAVFAGATNTPLACIVMGVELFGLGPLIPLMIACTVAYVMSSHRSIYSTQRIDTTKDGRPITGPWTVATYPHDHKQAGHEPA